MSAFIVEDKTINKIVSFLVFFNDEFPCNARNFWALGYDLEKPFSIEKLAKDMFFLNCAAVESRYGNDENFKDQKFKYIEQRPTTKVDAFKAIQCWIYQCSEGDVPTHPLYKAMDKLAYSIAAQIVSEIPEYDRCSWK